jgi:hypothetical protein
VDVLHAVERLLALAHTGPGADAAALRQVDAVLDRMSKAGGASGYKAEKLAAVRAGFDTWFSAEPSAGRRDDPEVRRQHLLRDIEHLKKALARGAAGQD